MSDTEKKIIEISLAKIESSKTKKGTGKLHKSLLVNSLLNRVRGTDTESTHIEPLMNYRESKLLVDLDIDDYDMDKITSVHERTNYHQRCTQASSRKQSSLVTKLNTRSLGKTDLFPRTIVNCDSPCDMKENYNVKEMPCECSKLSLQCSTCVDSPKRSNKRLHSIEIVEEDCPRKKLRCLWTPNINTKSQDSSFSVGSLSSLFGNLVAHSESEKSLDLKSKFVSAMVAY